MATYPVRNKETGETKDVVMSVHAWDQWREDNPDWERYYTPDNAPGVGEVGEWKDKLRKSKPGWNDVLHRAQKMPGSRIKKL
jgi:hypothetical protein|tara:strand:- start:1323 stop:1568 length:246 start_codon:yes stop_codon:yes gene_type:complete